MTKLTRGSLTLKEGILPVAELGKTGRGYTRMQVQNYYSGQRNMGLTIRDACRGTEFALNIHDIQVDSTGKTVVFFKESVEVVNPVTVQLLVDKVNAEVERARLQAITVEVNNARAQNKEPYSWAVGMSNDAVIQQLMDVNHTSYFLVVKPRKKYIAIDTKGGSGKFLVDTTTGLVHDIKGYGVIHPRNYGSLSDLTNNPRRLAQVSVGYSSALTYLR